MFGPTTTDRGRQLPDVTESATLTGVVLAGGFSRRFGERDKALARLDGEPLLARVVARLGRVADEIVVSCRTDQRDRFAAALADSRPPVRFAADPEPDRGPLYGFGAALDGTETERCALATCDAPFLDPRLLADLRDRLAGTDAAAAAVRTADGRRQPTQAVYRTARAEAACAALLDAGERRLAALPERLDCETVPADEAAGDAARSFFDVDTPADRERAIEPLDADSGAAARRPKREAAPPR